MTSSSAEDFNFVAYKVVSMAEFSERAAVIRAELKSQHTSLLSKVFRPLTGAVQKTKAVAFIAQNHQLGVYKHSKTSDLYVSGAFLKPFVTATFGASLNENQRLAAQKIFDECKDYRALLMIDEIKPIV
ncbi:MAG: hypothetical protein HYU57_08330 [Micavibrio aeruginosavorus]|nr:hypothetical protein [Micavibrio aeruginosavorus]